MSVNWICVRCGAFNHPRRSKCWRCQAARTALSARPDSRKEAVYAKLRAWKLLDADLAAETSGAVDETEINRVSWQARLRLFGGTLLAFLVVGLILIMSFDSQSISTWLILTFAVLVHETGHFFGMRYFGYKNIRMFFIPLFGAAVSGHNVNVSIVQESIVLLLGPVPGLLIGCVCGILYLLTQVELWRVGAFVFVLLNGVNLLPLYPLDGGQFVFGIFSGRSARSDTLLQVALTALFVGAGLLLSWTSVAGLALSLILRIRRLFKINKIVHRLREIGIEDRQDSQISMNDAGIVMDMMNRESMLDLSESRRVAETLVDIWRRAGARRPSLRETLALLFIYATGLLVFAVARFVYLADGI